MQNSLLSQDFSAQLERAIQPISNAITRHPALRSIHTMAHLARFSEIHVFAVWDFMSLLKALQRKLTHTQILWLPPSDHLGCHLVNTLLAEEESDHTADGRYLSHFELYLEAMRQCGADTSGITAFMQDIQKGMSLPELLMQTYVPSAARQFVQDTFHVIGQNTHEIAASFAYAREHITSGMFANILAPIAKAAVTNDYSVDQFIYYFQRHIELDGDKHSTQSKTLVANLCGADAKKWQEATDTAIFSLKSRLRLLDGIAAYIQQA